MDCRRDRARVADSFDFMVVGGSGRFGIEFDFGESDNFGSDWCDAVVCRVIFGIEFDYYPGIVRSEDVLAVARYGGGEVTILLAPRVVIKRMVGWDAVLEFAAPIGLARCYTTGNTFADS